MATVASTSLSFKAQVAQRVSAKTTAPKVVVSKAIVANSRREMLSFGALAGAAILAPMANAVEDYPIFDMQKSTKSNGFYEIYEARDLDVTERQVSGAPTRFALQKLTPEMTTIRVAESQSRFINVLPDLIEKEYYPVAQRELRRQIGYLRFDLEFLASLKSGAEKKAATKANKNLTDKIDALDFQLRQKSFDGSKAAYALAVSAWAGVV
eukprot:CAMPEP_0198230886 /NCGR_PEP_ID=MMETSP1445-20131203/114906_1 /TAXON_ID=36898 /ORGANISM="Pyramimonas sp., Strain CCMP2087" /LENGTH=209 /DNA_ID=CAMNT_0043911467 /DNA_START=97 /DNA_END=726 /DNA_ORIENTATION=+